MTGSLTTAVFSGADEPWVWAGWGALQARPITAGAARRMGRRNFMMIDVDEFQMFEKDVGYAMFRGLAKNSTRQGVDREA